jgi:hypothetical protein
MSLKKKTMYFTVANKKSVRQDHVLRNGKMLHCKRIVNIITYTLFFILVSGLWEIFSQVEFRDF